MITALVQHGEPADPRCPHVATCGGCAFQDRSYAGQVAAKTSALIQLWQHEAQAIGNIPFNASPNPFTYRTRMDYVTTKGRFGLRMRGRWNDVVELETCHLIPPNGFDVVHTLWQKAQESGLPDYHLRTHEGFLRYLVVRRSPQDTFLIAAVTASKSYDAEMEHLASIALAQPYVEGFHWLINESLTDLSFGAPHRHWGAATLSMRVGENTLHIGPNSFFQNNVHLLLPMLDAIKHATIARNQDTTISEQADFSRPRVADLYGGVGLIALHLVDRVNHVVTVESHVESAALARYNIEINHAPNVQAACEDVLPFLQRQLVGTFDTIVTDPPRTGMGEKVCAELARLAPQRIIYVSCNPLTQLQDIRQLAPLYQVTKCVGYDMFPHTPHMEVLAVMEKYT